MTERGRAETSPTESGFEEALAIWADVLGLIVRLHEREADAELLTGLREADLPALFEALLTDSDGRAVVRGFAETLALLPETPDAALLDDLAADYADIYLTHGYRVAPTGSVWMTEDHLERQLPMFEVREWYDHYGVTVPDWRLRSDDHIVHELQFVQHLLSLGTPAAALDAARFLDRHVLPWVPDFCARVAQQTRLPFHAMTNLLTRATVEALRDMLEALTGAEREIVPHAWKLEAERDQRAAEVPEIDRPYVPGMAESW